MAARKAIFTHSQNTSVDSNNLVQLSSPCMAVTKPQPWNYGGASYLISGHDSSYKTCLQVPFMNFHFVKIANFVSIVCAKIANFVSNF
jgi:hypothetical protein